MKEKLIFIGIILLAAFMRFYRFSALFHWTMDEEYWSYLPFNIATGYHFPLIGGHIAGTGLYATPWFIYLMAIPSKMFSGNPLGMGFVMASLGVLSTFLMFWVGHRLFNKTVGYLVAIFYGGSFLMAIFDRHYWNASLTPIFSVLVLYFLSQVILRKKMIFALPLTVILILAFSAHGTGMALVLFTLVAWIIFKIPLFNKMTWIALTLFLLSLSPLIIFELRHDFINLRALTVYFTSSSQNTFFLPTRAVNIGLGFFNSGSRLVYFPAKDIALEQTLGLDERYFQQRGKPPGLVIAIFFIFLFLGIFEQKKNIPSKLCLLLIGTTLVGLLIYKEKIPEYFFSPTFVPLIFLIAHQFSKLNKWVLRLILLIFILLNFQNILTVKHSFSYEGRMKAAQEVISRVSGKPFAINATCQGQDFCQLYGFRYLFTYLKNEPVFSYMDPQFMWLYEKRLSKVPPTQEVFFNMHDDQIDIQLLPK